MSRNRFILIAAIGILVTLSFVTGCFSDFLSACMALVVGIVLLGAPFLGAALVADWLINQYQKRRG